MIESAGEQGIAERSTTYAKPPARAERDLQARWRANENRKFDRVGRNLGVGGPGGGDSIPDQIEKLAQLYQSGRC